MLMLRNCGRDGLAASDLKQSCNFRRFHERSPTLILLRSKLSFPPDSRRMRAKTRPYPLNSAHSDSDDSTSNTSRAAFRQACRRTYTKRDRHSTKAFGAELPEIPQTPDPPPRHESAQQRESCVSRIPFQTGRTAALYIPSDVPRSAL